MHGQQKPPPKFTTRAYYFAKCSTWNLYVSVELGRSYHVTKTGSRKYNNTSDEPSPCSRIFRKVSFPPDRHSVFLSHSQPVFFVMQVPTENGLKYRSNSGHRQQTTSTVISMDRSNGNSIGSYGSEPDPLETTGFLSDRVRKSSESKERKKMPSKRIPLGVRVIQRLCIPTVVNRLLWYRIYILVLTFFFYAMYHLSRRPLSIAKNVLHQNCSKLIPPPNLDPAKNTTWCSWAPFDRGNSQELFSRYIVSEVGVTTFWTT